MHHFLDILIHWTIYGRDVRFPLFACQGILHCVVHTFINPSSCQVDEDVVHAMPSTGRWRQFSHILEADIETRYDYFLRHCFLLLLGLIRQEKYFHRSWKVTHWYLYLLHVFWRYENRQIHDVVPSCWTETGVNVFIKCPAPTLPAFWFWVWSLDFLHDVLQVLSRSLLTNSYKDVLHLPHSGTTLKPTTLTFGGIFKTHPALTSVELFVKWFWHFIESNGRCSTSTHSVNWGSGQYILKVKLLYDLYHHLMSLTVGVIKSCSSTLLFVVQAHLNSRLP